MAVFGYNGQVIVAWHSSAIQAQQAVHFTYIQPNYAEYLCAEQTCLRGDCNSNGTVDGDDIQPFVEVLLGLDDLSTAGCPFTRLADSLDVCRFDLTADCAVTIDDVEPFVCVLLGGFTGCDLESLGDGGGEFMMAGGVEGSDSCETYLSPAEEAYKEWLLAHTYRSLQHEMSLEEYRTLIKQVAVEYGLVKRWVE